jgi:putative flavoprotein involved in K+ transport
VVAYLARYAARLDADIRTRTRVATVTATEGGFAVDTADGTRLTAASVIAATGSFDNPCLPTLPGRDGFGGDVRHSSAYINPEPYAGQRVVVVGARNSAVQIGYELAKVASVTLATRERIRWQAQRPLGRDVHFWFQVTGFDRFPARLVGRPPGQPGDRAAASLRRCRCSAMSGWSGSAALPLPLCTVSATTPPTC